LEEISWDDAIQGIARHIKDTRDRTFVAKNAKGQTVNRTPGLAVVGGCTDTNEFNFLQWKFISALGVTYRDSQARVDTVHGGQSGRHVRTGSDDQRLGRHPERRCRPGHGRNPAENHPCGFNGRWRPRGPQRQAGGGDPRFTRTAAVADVYAPIRPGTDIAFLNGLIRYALETGRYHEDYVRIHTAGPYIVGEKFAFDDGLFSGFDPEKAEYDKSAWAYQPDPKTNGYQVDPTMKHPAAPCSCSRSTSIATRREMVERICGTQRTHSSKWRRSSPRRERAARRTIMYALGWTQHSGRVR